MVKHSQCRYDVLGLIFVSLERSDFYYDDYLFIYFRSVQQQGCGFLEFRYYTGAFKVLRAVSNPIYNAASNVQIQLSLPPPNFIPPRAKFEVTYAVKVTVVLPSFTCCVFILHNPIDLSTVFTI